MKNSNIFLTSLFLVFTFFTTSAQNPITSSELSKLSFEELGKLYLEKDTHSKEVIAEVFLQKARKENNHYNTALGYWYKSEVTKKDEEIVKYLDSMIHSSKKCLPSRYMLVISYYKKAYYFCSKRKYKIALDNYILANSYLKKSDDEDLYYNIQFDIAIIKSSLSNYKETLPIFLEYHDYCKRIQDTQNELTAIYAIAESYNRLDNLKQAKKYTDYGKKRSFLLKDYTMYNKFLCCEGINLFKEGKYSQSIPLLKNTLVKLKEDFANYSMNCFYIAKCYQAIKSDQKAIVYFKKIDSIFIKKNAIFLENIPAYSYLISYYEKRNDIRSQLYYTNNLIKADSVVDSNYDYLTEKIHKGYDIPQLILQKEALIQSLTSDKKHSSYFINILISISLIITGFAIYQHQLKKTYKIRFENTIKESKIKESEIPLISENEAIKETSYKHRYQDISKELVNQILAKLKDFESKKDYLKPNITIQALSKEFETNSRYLSKIVNEYKEKTFTQYVNELRIDYAISILRKNTVWRKYTMEALAQEFGFNSAESFSVSFSKKTGIKPLYFIKQIELDKLMNENKLNNNISQNS